MVVHDMRNPTTQIEYLLIQAHKKLVALQNQLNCLEIALSKFIDANDEI
jgi:hypothetical protein